MDAQQVSHSCLQSNLARPKEPGRRRPRNTTCARLHPCLRTYTNRLLSAGMDSSSIRSISNRPFHVVFTSTSPVRACGRTWRHHKKYAGTMKTSSNCEPLDNVMGRLLSEFQHRHFNHQEIGSQPILRRRLHLAECWLQWTETDQGIRKL